MEVKISLRDVTKTLDFVTMTRFIWFIDEIIEEFVTERHPAFNNIGNGPVLEIQLLEKFRMWNTTVQAVLGEQRYGSVTASILGLLNGARDRIQGIRRDVSPYPSDGNPSAELNADMDSTFQNEDNLRRINNCLSDVRAQLAATMLFGPQPITPNPAEK